VTSLEGSGESARSHREAGSSLSISLQGNLCETTSFLFSVFNRVLPTASSSQGPLVSPDHLPKHHNSSHTSSLKRDTHSMHLHGVLGVHCERFASKLVPQYDFPATAMVRLTLAFGGIRFDCENCGFSQRSLKHCLLGCDAV
jgi:hypothetical protein